ncbi:MAG: ABC transporter ATP-binding protein, partial [Desulfobacterales bacterium]
VGESGCGKSVTCFSIIRLIDHPGRIVAGEIRFKGRNLLELSESQMRAIRGNEIAMIFQDPMTALNPVLTIGDQLSEVLITHQGMRATQAKKAVIEMLGEVGITEAEKRFDQYVHSLSGGIQQRVMIAMALLCKPDLLIADEPSTALDVTIQAQILELMKDLQKDFATSIMFITHDLGVVAEIADFVLVMYGGKVVESADVKTLFKFPRHPYTVGLLRCLPKLTEDRKELYTIKGIVPNPLELTAGCKFHPRCVHAQVRCRKEEPPLEPAGKEHLAACWRSREDLFARD